MNKSFVDLMDYLFENFEITESDIMPLLPHLRELKLFPKEIIAKEGKRNQYIYFVSDGILRVCTKNSDNDDATLFYGFKNSFVASPDNYFTDEPSSISIYSVKKATVIAIDRTIFNTLCLYNIKFQRLNYDILQNFLKEMILHINILLESDSTSSYTNLLEKEKKFRQVPIKYLSAYFGIHPNSLSRIRFGLKKK